MNDGIPVGMASIAHSVPEWVVDNHYFERIVETSDEWIVQRTGISERHWLKPGQRPSDMFVEAGNLAMERAGVTAEDIDLIICGSVSGDFTAPSQACVIQDRLGIRNNCGAFDVAAACSGFMYALSCGATFVTSGKYKNVLVLGGEAMSRMINHEDRTTVVLFGDGAGATVLQPHDVCKQGLIEDFTLHADGSGSHFIIKPRGGGWEPMNEEILAKREHLIQMKGREVFRFAYSKMKEMCDWAMAGIEHDHSKLGLMLPHQMNRRILTSAMDALGIPKEKVLHNIHKYGNTSSASVPILFSEAWEDGQLEKDKYLILAAFGSGLTWAGIRIKW